MNTPYQYTGQEWEENDALEVYYYKARWYDPALRRFLQPDTIVPEPGNPQSLNRYSYAANSPIGNSDPTGHAVFSDVGAHLLYNPVNNNVMVRDIGGSSLHALIARVNVGNATAYSRLTQLLRDTRAFWSDDDWKVQLVYNGLGILTHTHFRKLGFATGDNGFAPEFRDSSWNQAYWGKETTQLGHLLTAIDMGMQVKDGTGFWLNATVGHEMVGDGKAGQIAQLRAPNAEDRQAFVLAIQMDALGDYGARDSYLQSILSGPRSSPEPLSARSGNSMEDLRLSVRGWRLGRMVAGNGIETNKDLATWVALNVAGD